MVMRQYLNELNCRGRAPLGFGRERKKLPRRNGAPGNNTANRSISESRSSDREGRGVRRRGRSGLAPLGALFSTLRTQRRNGNGKAPRGISRVCVFQVETR